MKRILTLFAAIPLVACSTYADEEAGPADAGQETVVEDTASPGAPSGQREYTDEERKFLESVNFCQEEAVVGYVGKEASDAMVKEIVEKSGSKSFRVLAPQDAATMDYRTDRVNIMTDEKGLIIRVRCG